MRLAYKERSKLDVHQMPLAVNSEVACIRDNSTGQIVRIGRSKTSLGSDKKIATENTDMNQLNIKLIRQLCGPVSVFHLFFVFKFKEAPIPEALTLLESIKLAETAGRDGPQKETSVREVFHLCGLITSVINISSKSHSILNCWQIAIS